MPALFSLRNHPHLLEINTWAWLEELSVKLGRPIALAGVPDSEWDALAAQGFNAVWLMGVWRRSPESRRILMDIPANRAGCDAALPGWKPDDAIGSPYAVTSYTVDRRIGTWASLDAVREKLHARGMALFLDFVGNHTAIDHPWTLEHPEFYIQGSAEDFQQNPGAYFRIVTEEGERYIALGRDPYFPPWPDVAQLNHFQPSTRETLLDVIRSIAAHCDGIRCDMAMLQLTDIFQNVWAHELTGHSRPQKEFWLEAHTIAPQLVLLAEAYWGTEQQLLDLGFSFTYDKTLYDCLRDFRAWDCRSRISASAEYESHMARFLENHDEQRRAVVFPDSRLHSVATLMGTLPGMRFYQQGEIEGRKVHLPINLRMAAPEISDPFSVETFRRILRITKEDVFHTGAWSLLEIVDDGDNTAGNLAIYEWRSKSAWKVIAVNLSGSSAQGRVRVGDRVSPGVQYQFNDELNEVVYPRDGKELHDVGLFVRLDAGQAHLFDVTPAST